MFEDNPFYTPTKEELNAMKEAEKIQEAAPVDVSISTEENLDQSSTADENISYDVKFIDNDIPAEPTKADKIDAVAEEKVQTPDTQKAEEKKSTGVSSYIEVPNIMGDDTKPQIQTFIGSFSNLLCIILASLYLIRGIRLGKFTVEKLSKFTMRFSTIIHILILALMCLFFTYPKTFNLGISGQLDFTTIFTLGALASINANILSQKLVITAKVKGWLKDKSYAFPGIKLLSLSLTLFSITTLLFAMLTESSISLIVLYLLCFSNKILVTIQKSKEKLELIRQDTTNSVLYFTTSIMAIGVLTNNYTITTIGAILTFHFMPINKKATKEKMKEEVKE